MVVKELNLSKQEGHCAFDRKKSRIIFVLLALFIVSWSFLLGFYTPEQIVEILSVQNVYIFVLYLQ